jgi:hypothetical protein
MGVGVISSPAFRRFTINDQVVHVTLSSALWQLFDALHPGNGIDTRLAMQGYYDSFVKSVPTNLRIKAGRFSEYVSDVLAKQAAERLISATNTPTVKPGRIDVVVRDYHVEARRRPAERTISVQLAVDGEAVPYSHFVRLVRQLEKVGADRAADEGFFLDAFDFTALCREAIEIGDAHNASGVVLLRDNLDVESQARFARDLMDVFNDYNVKLT